jgi:predicted nucleic acid-binding protein
VLAVDASLAIELCLDRVGSTSRAALGGHELVGPSLLWSETPSVMHEMRFRGEISEELADRALQRLIDNIIDIKEVRPPGLTRTAWEISTAFGWAKTYDAEYLGTAQLLGCQLVTVDDRLRRGADRLGFVVTPSELR